MVLILVPATRLSWLRVHCFPARKLAGWIENLCNFSIRVAEASISIQLVNEKVDLVHGC